MPEIAWCNCEHSQLSRRTVIELNQTVDRLQERADRAESLVSMLRYTISLFPDSPTSQQAHKSRLMGNISHS